MISGAEAVTVVGVVVDPLVTGTVTVAGFADVSTGCCAESDDTRIAAARAGSARIIFTTVRTALSRGSSTSWGRAAHCER